MSKIHFSCLAFQKFFAVCIDFFMVVFFHSEYTRQSLVVVPQSSFNQYYDPANPITIAFSTTEVLNCLYGIDPQPVTISSQRGETHFVHGILQPWYGCLTLQTSSLHISFTNTS